jgi:iron complex transport system permease protein
VTAAALAVASPARRQRVAARRRTGIVVASLAAVVLALFLVSMATGSLLLAPAEVLAGLTGSGDRSTIFVVRELRLPRAVAAVLVGLALGASGALFQRVLGNPLASPDFLGVGAGAGTAAVAALVLGGASGLVLPVAALCGATSTALAIYLLAWRRGITGYRFILVGIGVSAFATSVTSYLVARAEFRDARAALTWLVGSVGYASVPSLVVLGTVVVLLVPAGTAAVRVLRGLELGEDTARALGVRVQAGRLLVIGTAVVLIAAATATAGPIAFVALLAGPIAGALLGGARASLAGAALTGAVILQVADLAARYALPWPVSTGIVTGLAGAPYIGWLLIGAGRTGAAG